jgi:hypothetical protein
MGVLIALVIGYLFGAKTRGRDLDQLSTSLKNLYQTDEFADVVSAARVQVGNTLREMASIISGAPPRTETDGDLVTRVTQLVGRD